MSKPGTCCKAPKQAYRTLFASCCAAAIFVCLQALLERLEQLNAQALDMWCCQA